MEPYDKNSWSLSKKSCTNSKLVNGTHLTFLHWTDLIISETHKKRNSIISEKFFEVWDHDQKKKWKF